jgi:hypothetical protein
MTAPVLQENRLGKLLFAAAVLILPISLIVPARALVYTEIAAGVLFCLAASTWALRRLLPRIQKQS